MLLIRIIFPLILISFSIFSIYKIIYSTRKHNKRMRKLNEWSKFHKQLTEWSLEISDVTVRQKYMNECIGKLINHDSNNIQLIEQFSVEKEKEEIYKNWGRHIPSLLQEFRDKKINKLGI